MKAVSGNRFLCKEAIELVLWSREVFDDRKAGKIYDVALRWEYFFRKKYNDSIGCKTAKLPKAMFLRSD